MKKLIIILCILAILILGILFGLKLLFMPMLTGTLNRFVKNIDSPLLTVRFDQAEDTCLFRPCLRLENIYVRLIDKEFNGGTIQIEIPYQYPLNVKMTSLNKTPADLQIDANLNGDMLNINQLNLTAGDFSADLKGQMDTKTNQFNADLKTKNLARFIRPYIPQNMSFISNLFLSDSPQNLKLADSDGWLTIGGFPVLPLDQASLQNFMNNAKNYGTSNSHGLPLNGLDFNSINLNGGLDLNNLINGLSR